MHISVVNIFWTLKQQFWVRYASMEPNSSVPKFEWNYDRNLKRKRQSAEQKRGRGLLTPCIGVKLLLNSHFKFLEFTFTALNFTRGPCQSRIAQFSKKHCSVSKEWISNLQTPSSRKYICLKINHIFILRNSKLEYTLVI